MKEQRGYVLGPAPCRACRTSLYWTPAYGWRHREYVRVSIKKEEGQKTLRTVDGRKLPVPARIRVITRYVPHICLNPEGPLVPELRKILRKAAA